MTSSIGQPALSTDQVPPLLREHQLVWRQRYHLQRIGLVGSPARNEAKAGSDGDVWVELHPLTPFATVHLKQELEALLQRRVDLVRLRQRINPSLRQAILREGVSTGTGTCCTCSGRCAKHWRHRRPEAIPDDVLARLLALNAERYAAEQAMGLPHKVGGKRLGRRAPQPANGGGGRRRPLRWFRLGAVGRSRWGWGYEQPGDQIKTRAAV